ncbi:MAG: ribose 5-phosphate isomerase B [Thermodesulfobacteriota bacterium]|nr:ribose 5-phosphate isomerase B [Thermodesulfobacteriota bacterium]
MNIAVASDHAGFEIKADLVTHIRRHHVTWQIHDMGPEDDTSVDYPVYAHMVARGVSTGQYSRGILICGSGLGMSIMANRFLGVRAALCATTEMAELSRQHNNANILCLAARILTLDENRQILDKWLETPFTEDPRHVRRIDLMDLMVTR